MAKSKEESALDALWEDMQEQRNSQPDKTAKEILTEVETKYGGSGRDDTKQFRDKHKDYSDDSGGGGGGSGGGGGTTTPPPKKPPTAIEKFNQANDRLNREAVGFVRPQGFKIASPMAWAGAAAEFLAKKIYRGVEDTIDRAKLQKASEELIASGTGDPDSIRNILAQHGIGADDATVNGMRAVSQSYMESQDPEIMADPQIQEGLKREQSSEDLRIAVEEADARRQEELNRMQKTVTDTHQLLGQAQYEAQNNTVGKARTETINQGMQQSRDNIQGAMGNIGALLGGESYTPPTLSQPNKVQAYEPPEELIAGDVLGEAPQNPQPSPTPEQEEEIKKRMEEAAKNRMARKEPPQTVNDYLGNIDFDAIRNMPKSFR